MAERAHEAGIEVLPLRPALGDFNDDLRQLGLSALAEGVRAQLDQLDIEQLLISDTTSRRHDAADCRDHHGGQPWAAKSRAYGLLRGLVGPEPVRAGNGCVGLFSAAGKPALHREAK